MNRFLVSVFGADQPGIMAAVAGAIAGRGCNIENVSQTLLQDVFGALLIVAAADDETPGALKGELERACAALRLVVHVDRYVGEATPPAATGASPHVVTAIGPDRQGIVAQVSACLAKHGVNICNLQAVFRGGSRALDNLMLFEVDVPAGADMEALRGDLQAVSERLGLEVNVQHRRIFDAVSTIDNRV